MEFERDGHYQMGRYDKNILFVALWEMYDLMFSDCDTECKSWISSAGSLFF